MKKNELKQVLKPLIKECIKECIFEEGVLSGIITEVAAGLGGSIVETKTPHINEGADKQRQLEDEYEKKRQERIKRLNESAGQKIGIDIFEGTEPPGPESSSNSPLGGVDPGDPGINIDGIVNLSQGKWKHLIK
jgi:hypothetical protein